MSSLCKAESALAAPVVLLFICGCSGLRTHPVRAVSAAQSNVDRVTQALETLSAASFDDWKVSPALQSMAPDGGASLWLFTGDPTRPDFDDSRWKDVKLGEPIDLESCWMRKAIVLPEHLFGQPVSGSVKFRLSSAVALELWVNGQSKGGLGRNPEVELTNDAKPGQRFVVVVRATRVTSGSGSRPGPLRLSRAELFLERAQAMRQQLEDLILSLRAGQKLLSFDTYQTNARNKVDPGIDKSAIDKAERTRLNKLLQALASQIDVAALTDGSPDKFNASVGALRAKLGPRSTSMPTPTLMRPGCGAIKKRSKW